MRMLGNAIRKDFPIFDNFSKRLSFLDSAASTQKPTCVIKRLLDFYSKEYSNIQRGAYDLSAIATKYYEDSREKVSKFINAKTKNSVVFTRGTTESINLVSYALENYFQEGDVILLSIAEHHSNLIPWQMLAKRKNLKLIFVNLDDKYNFDLDDYLKKIKKYSPKLVAMTMLSNVLGTIFPIEEIIKTAKECGALTLLDAAQFVSHFKIDIQKIDPDFLCFSGHKIYGPTGIGVLYGKEHLLEKMQPFQGGGEMIETVTKEYATYAKAPHKFEAGTPAIGEAIALGTAIDFVEKIGLESIKEHEKSIFLYAIEELYKLDELTIYSERTGKNKSSVISFNIDNVHPHDFSSIADSFGVQIRSGFHCAMPLLNSLNIDATCRISFGVYSDKEDIDALVDAIIESKKIFGK